MVEEMAIEIWLLVSNILSVSYRRSEDELYSQGFERCLASKRGEKVVK